MIPKIIHLGWLGSDPLQEKMLSNIQKWRDLNPEYEIYCWFSSDAIGLRLREQFSERNILIHSIDDNPAFKNHDLVQEQLKMKNPLGAANIFLLDLMVHYGGYWFDLGFTPTVSIESVPLPKSDALCELDSIPSVQTNGSQLGLSGGVNGCYHFHASAKGGELYSLAQRLQRDIIKEIKKDKQFSPIFETVHPAVKYQATKNTMGLTVFLAVECMVLKNYGKPSAVAICKASLFGTPKERNPTYFLIPGEEKTQFDTYLEKVKRINRQLFQKEMLSIIRADEAFYKQTFFSLSNKQAKLKQAEESLMKEASTFFNANPNKISSTFLELIKNKQYDMALRKACSIGACAFIKILLKYADALEIDVKKSSSNGNTALIWLEKSTALEKDKEEITTLLEQIGRQNVI